MTTTSLMHAQVLEVLEKHANHPSAFLATNKETRHFTAPGVEGMIAYRLAGRAYVVIAAGIIAPPEKREAILERFLAWARQQRRKVIAVQVMKEDARLLSAKGFTVNQIGASYSRSLANFKLSGTPFIKLHNKIAKARRAGIEVLELGVDLQPSPRIRDELAQIDASWLSSKGSHTKELAFLIGEVGDVENFDRRGKRLFLALRNDEVIGYILYTASFGAYKGWMHDLSRRAADAPPGVMELVNVTAIERFREENVEMLNFGFTPLTGLNPENERALNGSRIAARVFRMLARHGSLIYPAATQLQYKLKWAPDVIESEYIAFQGGFSLGGLWHFLRLTRAI